MQTTGITRSRYKAWAWADCATAGEHHQGGRQKSESEDSGMVPTAGPGLQTSQSHALLQERFSEYGPGPLG